MRAVRFFFQKNEIVIEGRERRVVQRVHAGPKTVAIYVRHALRARSAWHLLMELSFHGGFVRRSYTRHLCGQLGDPIQGGLADLAVLSYRDHRQLHIKAGS